MFLFLVWRLEQATRLRLIFYSCNAGLLWLVAADQIASHFDPALFYYVTMRTHNLWKMLTQRKVNNVKMKTDQNKLHFEFKMAVVAGKCGWCFDVVLVVLIVLELVIEVSCKLIYTYLPGFSSLGHFVNRGSPTDCDNQSLLNWFTCTKLINLRTFYLR